MKETAEGFGDCLAIGGLFVWDGQALCWGLCLGKQKSILCVYIYIYYTCVSICEYAYLSSPDSPTPPFKILVLVMLWLYTYTYIYNMLAACSRKHIEIPFIILCQTRGAAGMVNFGLLDHVVLKS